ncbi:MAG: metalloregulator ArsR/SmtB family transcription factor [Deltaproteobacteria bacterium]|nr:metalloregulator ArsR/SmtB family transcription factor [Deltaproteobacteria bacterium]
MEHKDAVGALAALAQDTRLDIFRLLVETGPEGLPAGQIGKRLGLPLATLSFHLNTLKQAGLVEFRRESRSLIYRSNFETMNDLLRYLTDNCCGGNPEVCGIPVCEPTQEDPWDKTKKTRKTSRVA